MTVEQLRSLGVQAVALIALIALIAHPAFSADDLELPAGEVMGGFVEDDGTGVLLVTPWGTREDGPSPEDGTFVVRFSRTGTEIEVLPDFSVNDVVVLEDGLLSLGGSTADYYVRRVVDVSKDEAEVLWDSIGLLANPSLDEADALKIAGDGSRWGVMRTGLKKWGTEREIEFFFGDLDSHDVDRKVTVVIPEEHYDPGATEYPSFVFLDSPSESPLLAVAFSGEVFVLRIVGSSVRSEYLEHGKGNDLWGSSIRWQPTDRILWANWGSEWSGYDLWDLGLSAESPIPATLQEDAIPGYATLNRPHRQAGFVSMLEDSDTLPIYLRDERAPTTVQFSREGFETRSGTLKGRLDQVFVSPNGYYAVAILWRAWGEVRGKAYVAKVFPLH